MSKYKEVQEEVFKRKEYLKQLEHKYKDVPQEIKRQIVDRDYKNMLGRDWTPTDNSGSFIFEFNLAIGGLSKTVKKNVINKIAKNILIPNEYFSLRNSGMFFEFFPQMTGVLREDVEEFTKFWFEREEKKGWIKLII